jgi:oligopeptide transport system substrate-binding protein
VAPIPSANQPVNGAYRFDGYEPGGGVWLIHNESYYEAETVRFQNVIYRPYDRQRALASFADGELLISNDVPVFALSEIAEEFGAALREARYSGSFFLATNMPGVLADSDLRRAIALAIDRIRLADEIWLGTMIPTLSLLPAGLADQTAPAVAGLGPNDPSARQAEARALLLDAGYNSDNPLTLILAIGDTELQQLTGESIAQDLAEIGIVVNLVYRSAPDHQAHILGDRDYDLATVAWIGAVGHVDEYLALFDVGDLDITGYGNPAISSLLAEAGAMADWTVRSALYAAADRAVSAQRPAIALMHYASFNLVSTELEGWEDNVINIHLSRWLRPRTAEVE